MATLISDELRWAADQVVNHLDYPSAVLSGIAPNSQHLKAGGFHCSIEDLIAHGNGGDYSNTRTDDKGFNPKYGAAFDVSFSKTDMIKAYGRVHAVWADKSDPRRQYVNAINCWSGTGDATRFDFDAGTAKYASPDHEWHVHGEIHRRWVREMKAARAVASIFQGEAKANWIAREESSPPFEGDDVDQATIDAIAAATATHVWGTAWGRDVRRRTAGDLIQETRTAAQTAAANSSTLAGLDPQQIIAGVLNGLNPAQIAAAIVQELPADLAKETADELAARLAT